MTDYKLMLRDQVRLNNVIDAATQDALDMLVDLNDEFQMLYFNELICSFNPCKIPITTVSKYIKGTIGASIFRIVPISTSW